MGFKEKAIEKGKDVGAALIGKGRERQFEKDTQAYERTHGVTPEVARKRVFLDQMGAISHDFLINGHVEKKSENWKNFEGAFGHVFTPDQWKQFTKDAKDPAIFRGRAPFNPAAATREIGAVRGYYRREYGKVPDPRIIMDAARQNKEMQNLISRFTSDPRWAGGASIESIIAGNPELGADMGALFNARLQLGRHEGMNGAKLDYQKHTRELAKTAPQALWEMAAAPFDLVGDLWKSGFKVGKSMEACTRALKRETVAAGKLGWGVTKAGYAGGKYLFHKYK